MCVLYTKPLGNQKYIEVGVCFLLLNNNKHMIKASKILRKVLYIFSAILVAYKRCIKKMADYDTAKNYSAKIQIVLVFITI